MASGQWWTRLKGGDPETDHVRLTQNSRAGNPKRQRPNCHKKKEVLSKQRGWHQFTKGRGPKDPSVRQGGDPRTLASRRHWLLQVVAATAGGLWTAGEGRPTSASSTSLPSSSTVVSCGAGLRDVHPFLDTAQ